jgi:hypothetical protein
VAGIYPVDISEVQSAETLHKQHAHQQVKQHTILDAQGRPKFIFTAYIGSGEGDPCLVTEYTYSATYTTTVIARQERVYKWKVSWDTGLIFDPTVSYDADGDGNL